MSLRGRSTVFPSTTDRMQLQASSGRGYGSSAALLPLGNRRPAPSKWDDAEKWICSPISDGLAVKNPVPPAQRRGRPKSKSGPLGPHYVGGGGGACLSASSLLVSGSDDGRARTFATNSPVLREEEAEGGGFGCRSVRGRDGFDVWDGRLRCGGQPEVGGQRASSATVHGWSELLMEASSYLPTPQEERPRTALSDVLRKDVGTQMSPAGSACSSPEVKKHAITLGELHKHLSKLELRDVRVQDDDRDAATRWPERRASIASNARQCKKRIVAARTRRRARKTETEEERIMAWENQQKAKADAAVRELEMKLEKERASSMEKIMNKLSSAQRKAEEMRRSATAGRATGTPRKATFLQRLHLFHGCFINQADAI